VPVVTRQPVFPRCPFSLFISLWSHLEERNNTAHQAGWIESVPVQCDTPGFCRNSTNLASDRRLVDIACLLASRREPAFRGPVPRVPAGIEVTGRDRLIAAAVRRLSPRLRSLCARPQFPEHGFPHGISRCAARCSIGGQWPLLVMPSGKAPPALRARAALGVRDDRSRASRQKPAIDRVGRARTIKPADTPLVSPASIWLAPAIAGQHAGQIVISTSEARRTGRAFTRRAVRRPPAPHRRCPARPTTRCPASATTLAQGGTPRQIHSVDGDAQAAPKGASLSAASLIRAGRSAIVACTVITRAAPDEAKGRPFARCCRKPKFLGDVSEPMRRCPIDTQDDVARQNSCLRRGAAFNEPTSPSSRWTDRRSRR